MTNYLQKASSPNAITLGIRVLTYKFVEGTNMQLITLRNPETKKPITSILNIKVEQVSWGRWTYQLFRL